MLGPTSHTVAPGENLTGIARRHGLKSWQLLYYAPINEPFRKLHPNPDVIPPGAKLFIPANPQAQAAKLRDRVNELRKLRQDILQFGDQGKRELQTGAAKVKAGGSNVDTIATVATLFVNLGQLLKKGFAWNAAEGALQKQLGEEIVRDASKELGKKQRDAAAILISAGETQSASPTWLAIKAVAQAWCDITSPSFWANTASQLNLDPMNPGTWSNLAKVDWSSWSKGVTTRPEDVEKQARDRWDQLIKSSLQRIDDQIREAERALM